VAFSTVAKAPDERWASDLCRVWTGRDGWASLALVIDCYSRELLGWHLSRSGRSKTAEAALEQALIARYGCSGKVAAYPAMPLITVIRVRSSALDALVYLLRAWPPCSWAHHPCRQKWFQFFEQLAKRDLSP
jgi:transposase InsO family protein